MADLDAIIDGLNEALRAIDGLHICENWPEQITPPAAAVQVEGGDYDTTMNDDSQDVQFVVHVWTSKTSNRAGLSKLWTYLRRTGDSSVKQALEADQSLGGVAEFVAARQFRTPGFATFGEMQYYAGEVVVVVGASGL
jgi:hypothetical protein